MSTALIKLERERPSTTNYEVSCSGVAKESSDEENMPKSTYVQVASNLRKLQKQSGSLELSGGHTKDRSSQFAQETLQKHNVVLESSPPFAVNDSGFTSCSEFDELNQSPEKKCDEESEAGRTFLGSTAPTRNAVARQREKG